MNSTTYLTLDLQAPNLAVVASAKQNDTRGRQIAATLRDGSAAFDATGLLCEIRYAKPDGTVGFYDTLEDNTTPAYSIDGNVVTFTLAEQMLTVAGAVYVDVNFYAATGEKLTAFAFVLQVEASVLSDGTIESSDYYNVLTATLAQAVAVAEEAAEIAANLPVPYTGLPENLGTPSSGSAVGFSRGDHVHDLSAVIAACLLAAHPVGSYYWSDDSTDPATLFGGTWTPVKDKFILAAGDTYTAGNTGGEATHTLTANEMPSHTHTQNEWLVAASNGFAVHATPSGVASTTENVPYQNIDTLRNNGWADASNYNPSNTGGGAAHNNMPPYVVAYCWKRTA